MQFLSVVARKIDIMSISRCSSEDILQIKDLFKRIYRGNPRLQEDDYLNWQFKNVPFQQDDKYNILIKKNIDNQIVGCLGYLPLLINYKNQIRRGCYTSNWYSTQSDVSGLELMNQLVQQFDNVLLIGINPQARQIYNLCRIPTMIMPRVVGILDVNRIVDLFLISKQNILPLREACCKIKCNIKSLGISSIDRFSSSAEMCFDNSVTGYVIRTGRYLNWRYVDIPRHDYKIITNGAEQFAVYRVEKILGLEDSVVRILEWNFSREFAANAVGYILQQTEKEKVVLIDFFCTSAKVRSVLTQNGFLDTAFFQHDYFPYLFRPLNLSSEEIALGIDIPPHRRHREVNLDEWYITKGDSDLDRIKL